MEEPKKKLTLQELCAIEYKKCAASPVYFMKTYVKIQTTRGAVNFKLYPFQENTLSELREFPNNIILKARQMGISTLVSAYCLWLSIFNKDQNILIISLRQDEAIEVLNKFSYANEKLPPWLKMEMVENNKKSIKFKNGSTIKASSTTSKSGVGKSLTLLIIDECLGFLTDIYIRNKQTGEVKTVKIGELYESKEYK